MDSQITQGRVSGAGEGGGTGLTTVMTMIIAWQAINGVRHPNDKSFTRGFLVVVPGVTIKERLRVPQPNDPGQLLR